MRQQVDDIPPSDPNSKFEPEDGISRMNDYICMLERSSENVVISFDKNGPWNKRLIKQGEVTKALAISLKKK